MSAYGSAADFRERSIGMLVMGGEAYITFKPDLVDASGAITDETTKGFLNAYLDQFAALMARFAVAHQAAA
jgi:chromate reductase